MSLIVALLLFLVGAVLAIFATERLLEGLVSLALLLTPVRVEPQVMWLDWPALLIVTWLAAAFLWHGRVGRSAGGLLLLAYAAYVALHVVLR